MINNNVSIFGMPEEKWILNGLDLTLLVRDYMYYMSRQLEIMPVEHNFARL
jgi:hypothetical protein